MKGQTILFSKASDEWATPPVIYNQLNDEFAFTVDGAATVYNTKCALWLGPGSPWGEDALQTDWGGHRVWLNPPYSACAQFVAKAADAQSKGALVVMLLPARTDTKWFHAHIYHKPDVEVRFLKGRLKFGDATNSAPFPSMVVVMRPDPWQDV